MADLWRAGRFADQDIGEFERTMQLNYFGSLYLLKAAIDGMLRASKGHVVLVTSVAATIGACACAVWYCWTSSSYEGQLAGIAGFSSYSPSKYALRGLGDVLRNELLGTGLSIQVAYPMDTQTPGYDVELLHKAGFLSLHAADWPPCQAV